MVLSAVLLISPFWPLVCSTRPPQALESFNICHNLDFSKSKTTPSLPQLADFNPVLPNMQSPSYMMTTLDPSASPSSGVPGTLTHVFEPCQKSTPSTPVDTTTRTLSNQPTALPYEKTQLDSHRTNGVTSSSLSLIKSGFTVHINPVRASSMALRNTHVSTWMTASRIDMFLVVCRTSNPAATSGVTWLKALSISLEYGMPMLCLFDQRRNTRRARIWIILFD